ncbi:MAG: CRISPR-associated endonuclease Cas1 [Armatimonadia bacterium]|nr:CRISPR-associated endonuclease Cas1 [Armatimonadia bacterium]
MEAVSSTEALPVRMLNEFVYCPRLFHIEHVQGLFAENVHTIEGSDEHSRQRTRAEDQETPWPAPPRRLHLECEEYGLTGILDAIDSEDGTLAPVDYKHGVAPDNDRPIGYGGIALAEGAWANDQIQVCAQGVLLEAGGHRCDHAYLYYRASKKRVRVALDGRLRAATTKAIEDARATRECREPPMPLIDSPKCIGCSLAEICLPDETLLLSGRTSEAPRRLAPGREDAGILYITGQGTSVGKSGERLTVRPREGAKQTIPLKDIAHVSLFGNVQVTAQALSELLRDGRTIAYFSRGGWLRGIAHDFSLPNVLARAAQFRAMADDADRLRYARAFVAAKIHNQRVLLMRNTDPPQRARTELRDLARRAEEATETGALMGLEGRAAAIYFEHFAGMVKAELPRAFDMAGRNRRPPRDPINAMLSFGYAVLVRDVYAALVATGLDPMVGYLHAVRAGRPALALDIMEPYRPLIVDSVVVRALNTGEIRPEHFDIYPGQVSMTRTGRQAFLRAYERRMDELIRHPDFDYSISYRRVLSVECRLLAKALSGEPIAYRPLRTR